MASDAIPPQPVERAALRNRLLAQRDRLVASPAFMPTEVLLTRRLVDVLHQLEPECLGIYWPIRSEFNAVAACAADPRLAATPQALPWCRKSPIEMFYRRWDGQPPREVDECAIATADGERVTPDVVLLPCLGFTLNGFRLGYGAGYFDRWQAANPSVTTVGVAWAIGELAADEFVAQPHDQALTMVVTEHGVIG